MSKLLESAALVVDAMFDSEDGPSCAFSSTREPYVTLCSQGIKEEGQFPKTYDTPEKAISEWLKAFLEYSQGKGSRLIWRVRPKLECSDVTFEEGRYYVRSRLIVTDKPDDPEYTHRVGFWSEYSETEGAAA